LPPCGYYRQRGSRRAQRDPGVDAQISAGQANNIGNETDQPLPCVVGDVIVHLSGEKAEQRMRAGRMVAPPFTGKV